MVEHDSNHLRGILAQFDTGPDLQEQVDADQKPVPNVEQTFNKKIKAARSVSQREFTTDHSSVYEKSASREMQA